MIYSSIQVPPALYMDQRLPSGRGHIIDHLNVERLLCIHVLGYEKWTLRGQCAAQCIDGHIIELPKGFKYALIISRYSKMNMIKSTM